MGWLKRLLFGEEQERTPEPEPPVDRQHIKFIEFTEQRPDAELDIVGESHRQEELRRFAGPGTEYGVTNERARALVMPEPDNPVDKNAIVVYLTDMGRDAWKVGYLSRRDAIAY